MNLDHWTAFWACVIGVLSVARTARLIVWDEFPPSVWLRIRWDDLTHKDLKNESRWNKLLHCQFCITPYLAAGNLGWAVWSGLGFGDFWGLLWWIANGVWGLSYLSASYVAWDQED